MKNLTRPLAPNCLSRYHHPADNWKNVYSSHKRKIWLKLELMQGTRCAYCEILINKTKKKRDGHIEHFEQRSRSPNKTFDWHNLFGSCNRSDSCGTFKDKQKYTSSDLIKPDIEDPGKFLIFLPDGTVSAKQNLSITNKKRAEETIRVFHLDGSLTGVRKSAVSGYLYTAEALAQLINLNDGYATYYSELSKELAAIKGKAFESAIRQILFNT